MVKRSGAAVDGRKEGKWTERQKKGGPQRMSLKKRRSGSKSCPLPTESIVMVLSCIKMHLVDLQLYYQSLRYFNGRIFSNLRHLSDYGRRIISALPRVLTAFRRRAHQRRTRLHCILVTRRTHLCGGRYSSERETRDIDVVAQEMADVLPADLVVLYQVGSPCYIFVRWCRNLNT